MGTKGRDIVFWLFVLFLAGAALFKSKVLFWAASGFACLLAAYYRIYVPAAIKRSRAMGLKAVVLLPLWPGFAHLYRLMAGRRIAGKWKRAWEIHVTGASPELDSFLRQLQADLARVRHTKAGLFYWETSAPVPSAVRRLIRDSTRQGRAFWRKGAWPVPRAPGTARELAGKYLRCGAIILEERRAKYE